MNKKKFGSYIKELRIKKNYTQQELADLLFVDVSTVSKWERGVSYPDITLVPDICRVLEVSEHELIASSHDEEYRTMKKDATKYKNMKKTIFWSLNISYLIAILVCFIVNVSVSQTLSWFYIVLTSILCAYSFCPTITWMVSSYKREVFIGSTFASMFLLFLTCSLYTGNYWFLIATFGVLLGYFLGFYPFIFKAQKKYLSEDKYNKFSKWFLLTYVLGMLIITTLLLVSIYFYMSFNLKLGLFIMGGCFMFPIAFGVLNLFAVAKKLNKPLLLGLLGLILAIIFFGLFRAVYLKNSVVSKTYIIEESYSDIQIKGTDLDINIYTSKDNENKVVYDENKKIKVELKIEDGVLIVNQVDNRKFYDYMFNFSDLDVDLYLSKELINTLIINNKVGDVEIAKGLTFNNIKIEQSTGDVAIESIINNNLNIVTSTGDVEIENTNIGGNADIKCTTGDIELNGVRVKSMNIKISTGSGELTKVLVEEDFTLEGSTGNVKIDEFDAKNISITLSTGNVEGNILSNKVFIVQTKTGSVNVPETVTGGKCKIVTRTGNINIKYK